MALSPEMAQLGNVAAAVLVGWLVLKGYRSIRRHSRLLGRIVAAGILARAAVGLALFWISYLQLPVAASFHSGDGFWELATDARGYYQLATFGASEALRDVESVPSPVFVRTLALWMSLVGVSPASALFLNLSLYVVLILVVVWYYEPVDDWRRDLPCIVGVAAYSFSPVLLLHSTQALKDNLSCTFIGFACLGVLGIRGLIYRESEKATARAFAIGVVLLSVATFGMAGIRWYYAALMLGAVATVLGVFAVRGRSTPWRPYIRGCAVVSAALFIAFLAGAGPTYRESMLESAIGGPRRLAAMIEGARTGFISAGGATNIGSVVPTHSEEPSKLPTHSEKQSQLPTDSQEHSRPRVSTVLAHQAKGLSLGTAFLFLPTSFIATTSGIALQGGQGLLPFVDLDTIFQDVAIVCILALLWTRRRNIGTRLPLVVFGLVLALASAILMAYVVTNVGTMVRLRLLVMVPLWLLGLAVTARQSTRVPSAVDRASTNPASAL